MATGRSERAWPSSSAMTEVDTAERFFLPVTLVSSGGINPSKIEVICEYVKKELLAFQTYANTFLGIECLCLCDISCNKDRLSMEFAVNNTEHLNDFYNIAQKTSNKELNVLSETITKYFDRQMMHAACGFCTKDKVTIKIVMQKAKYEQILKKLKNDAKSLKLTLISKLASPSCRSAVIHDWFINVDTFEGEYKHYFKGVHFDDQSVLLNQHLPWWRCWLFGPKPMVEKPSYYDTRMIDTDNIFSWDGHVKKTFMIHIPEDDYQKVSEVRMRSSVKQLDRSMQAAPNNMFVLQTSLPLDYNSSDSYWFEIMSKTSYFLFSRHNSWKSVNFIIGDSEVNRNILSCYGCRNIIGHLFDILYGSCSRFSQLDLIHQSINFCKEVQYRDVKVVLQTLLSADIQGKEAITRLALIIGSLTRSYGFPLQNFVPSNLAEQIISSLVNQKLVDFPSESRMCLSMLCKELCQLSNTCGNSMFEFIETFWEFFEEELILGLLQDSIKKKEEVMNAACLSGVSERSLYLIKMYFQTGNTVFKELLEIFIRHCPVENVVQLVCSIQQTGIQKQFSSNENDVLVVIMACTRANLLSGINKLRHDKLLIELLNLAIMEVQIGLEDEAVQNALEESILELYSLDIKTLKHTLLQSTLDCLKHSRCFKKPITIIKLMQTIVESNSSKVRGLLVPLLDQTSLHDTFTCLDVSFYRKWLQHQFEDNPFRYNRDENELEFSLRNLISIINVPVVKQRHDVCCSLNEVFVQWLQKYSLKELIQSIPKVEKLFEKEPTVGSLYEEQVKQQLSKPGKKAHDVLLYFCRNDQLMVDTQINAQLICTTIDIFFKEDLEKSCCEIFVSMLKHVKFWKTLKEAKGKYIGSISKNKTYLCIFEALQQFAQHVMFNELKIQSLFLLIDESSNAKALLKIAGMEDVDITKSLQNFKDELKAAKDRTGKTLSVVKAVQERCIPTVPDMKCIILHINEILERIDSRKASLKECMSVKWQWGDMASLPSMCKLLHDVVESEVFWNVSSEAVIAAYSEKLSQRSDLKTLLFVRFMYNDYLYDEDVDIIETILNAIDFFTVMKGLGVEKYKTFWETLETNPEIKMIDVTRMFRNANVPDELEIAEAYFKKPMEAKTRTTLMQIWETKDVIHTANAIESVINVLGYHILDHESLKKDINSFKELTGQKVDEYTLHDIHNSLTNIFGLTKSLSELTVEIMKEMGQSKQLIEFLQEIAIDDIRNLIDAVEDISESHVQESTVSALIEIKRFLSPLLNPTFADVDSKWVFATIEKQTDSMKGQAKCIPAKICDCMDNLHNLKSLYNNVANRGQQTKEIIRSIVTKGEFMFILYPDMEVVTYSVLYKENKNKYEKQETTLLDIRSRALLLLNTERTSSESSFNASEFRSFINSIDLCVDIRDALLELYTSGNIRFSHFKKKFPKKALEEIKESLQCDLNKWTSTMEEIRGTCYLMNFIRGSQIHSLNNFLQEGCTDPGVSAILKFIHPDLSELKVLDVYKKQPSGSADEQIKAMSHSIHEAYDDLALFHRNMPCTDCTKKIGDCVQVGNMFVCQLEEHSNYVLKTILALYHNSTHHLPEPNQLLFCSPDTKWYEIELLLQRCKGAFEFYGSMPLYCIANVEKLQNDVQFKLVDELQQLKSGSKYLLAIVCRGTKHHPFVDRLSGNLALIQPMSDMSLQNLLKDKFSNVHTFTSEVAGLGKTLQINKDAAKQNLSTLTLHVSGTFGSSTLVECLMNLNIRAFHVLHIDIGSVDDLDELDMFLFQLIVLRFVSSGVCAFYLCTGNVSVEIANSINNILRNSLLAATSFKRIHLKWNDFEDFNPSMEINSPVQVVCHYLTAIDHGQLDQRDLKFSGDGKVSALPVNECRQVLRKHMATTSDISFSIVHIFLNVLAEQLKKFSCSSFFKVSRIGDMIGKNVVPTIRSNLVKSMIEVSREFASRSVNACRSEQSTTLSYEVAIESSSKDLAKSAVNRVDNMIRWEESNHLIYVFHNQNIQTLSAMYRDKMEVPDHVRKMFETQMNKQLPDFSQMKQLELQQILQRVARLHKTPLSNNQLTELSRDYALTPDNLLKMVLIMMRVQSKVPIVIMGETGCGKTSLIRYLANISNVSFQVMNIHAGTKPEDVVNTVMQSNANCMESPSKQNWLFLDEINTSENIGLICDIICHRKCNGTDLMPNLIIMGACNPYKLRTNEAIKTAGLTGKIKTDDLSKLVYRVLPLPEMMVDYVWDFGSLNEKDERLYIERMIEEVFKQNTQHHTLLSALLASSQKFVRAQEVSTCVVSLRDVHRCKILTSWFSSILKRKETKTQLHIDISIKAMVLALAHCYHSRFMDKSVRLKYRQVLSDEMKKNGIDIPADSIYQTIQEEQKDILERMDLPPGIAKNSALQENLFVILVCILNKIPIFVVGKPGCSKSLAMQVIRSNLRGKDSKDDFFKMLPQLYCVSFQGSESSTSDGIQKVFEKAENYQKSNTKDDVLSVVILDEIGLAEVSRFNPLKVLHSLLEPEGRSRPNVAVVGISNWALDASKMNRAVHLSRPDMDEDELFETALSISKSFTDSIEINQRGLSFSQNVQCTVGNINMDLRQIVKSYILYTKQLQFKHFHGLRDFYFLVKFVSRKIALEKKQPVPPEMKTDIIIEGLQRNFGGLRFGNCNIMEHFKLCFSTSGYASSSTDELIAMNINDCLARHLMVITKGESVLGIIERHLHQLNREGTEIIFGSQFEEDLTDDYNYRILSKIILCMEQGIVLILKDLENIYGSLYDMLNQNYTRIGKKNNCRVALGPYSNPFCHVAESFRCIVLVEENKLDYSDPPFLNRFEKQYLTFSDVLNSDQRHIVCEIKTWLSRLTTIADMPFSESNAFPYFNEELLVSLVLYNEAHKYTSEHSMIMHCKQDLLWLIRPEVILRLEKNSNAEIRETCLDIQEEYFALPIHHGLGHLIKYQIQHKEQLSASKITIIFTNSNIHTKLSKELLPWKYQSEKIGAFKSEKQLSVTLKQFWDTSDSVILLVHCNAEEDGKHLMLTKSLIEKNIAENHKVTEEGNKLVYILVHLNGRDLNSQSSSYESMLGSVSQINFLSGCKLAMLDSLEPSIIPLPILRNKSLFEMMDMLLQNSESLKNEIFWAFTRIKFGEQGRDVDSIINILNKIKKCDYFLHHLAHLLSVQIHKELTLDENEGWCVAVACDIQALNTCANFVNALEEHVKNIFKKPLAKLLYKMELMGILDCFFIDDECKDERRSLWFSLVSDKRYFCLDDIPDPSGPECYFCDTPDIALQMPFSSVIYESVERNKDHFLDGVMHAKVKCEIDADGELPGEVMDEIKLIHEAYIASAVSEYFVEYSYSSLIEDYIIDFCNLYSNNLVSHLNRESRIYYTKWMVVQKIDLKGEQLLVSISNLHCFGWMYCSRITPALQLLELCSDVFDEALMISLPINQISDDEDLKTLQPLVTNSTSVSVADTCVEELNSEQEIQPDIVMKETVPSHEIGSIHENHCIPILKEFGDNFQESVVSGEDCKAWDNANGDIHDPVAMTTNSSDSEEEEKVSQHFENITDIVSSVDALEGFVAIVSHRMLVNFINGASRKLLLATRNFLTLATEVSDVSHLLKLRLCNDVATYFLEPNVMDLTELEPLARVLEDKDLDSEEVFNELVALFETVSNKSSAMTKSRTMCQYLFRCISSDENTTAYRYLFGIVNDFIIPENEYELLKEPLYTFMQDIDVSFCDVLFSSDYGYQDEIDDSLLSQLNLCLQQLPTLKQQDGPFTLMIVDMLQNVIDIPEDEYDFADLMKKAGIILQKEKPSLLFITAVAFLKSSISKINELIMQNENGCASLLNSLNAVIVGLENAQIEHTIKVFFLKTLGQRLSIHSIKKCCDDLSESVTCVAKIKWAENTWTKLLEYNPLAIHLPEQILKEGEILMVQTDSFEQNMNKIKSIVLREGYAGKLLLFSLAMSEFYTRRYREMLDDTVKSNAEEFLQVALCSMDSDNDKTIMHFLTGKQDLPHGMFEMSEQTSFQWFMINTSLVSLYCLMLTKNKEEKSLLSKCLLSPSEIQELFVPGVAKVHTAQWVTEDCFQGKATFALCSCNNRLLLTENAPLKCVVCSKELQAIANHFTEFIDNTDRYCKGYLYKNVDHFSNCADFLSNMSALSFHLLHFLLKGALLGSLVLDTKNFQMIEEVLSVSEIDLFKFLTNSILYHWTNIGHLTNLDDFGIGQLFQTVLKSSDHILFKNFPFKSLSTTEKWEQEFDSYVSHIFENSLNAIHKHKQQFNTVYELSEVSIEAQIRELDTIDKYSDVERSELLPTTFRLAKPPTRSNFVFLLSLSKGKYPFLSKVLQFEKDLKLPIYLYSIIQWHLVTCVKVSYSMKRWQCADMSVREFLDKWSGKGIVKKVFNAFKAAIVTVKKHLGDNDSVDIPSLNENSKLQDCLLLDEHCWLYKLLSKLVHIQNEFIDFCLMLSFNCKNLQFLIRDEHSACLRSVRLTELKTENLINMKMDDESFNDFLLENSCSELAYGRGHLIKYDFHNIEKDLVYDLLIEGRKCYITQTGLQYIVFKDELYRTFVSLLKDVNLAVSQKPLPSDLAAQIKKTNAETPNMASELINHLDMIFTLLKRTKCDSETSLTEYIKTYSNMIGQDFPKQYLPSPEGRLKVCHVVSLHGLLEELCAERVIGSLEEKYDAELYDYIYEYFRTMPAKSLHKAETVAKALKRFIYRCIYMCETPPEQPLLQLMNDPSFWAESAMYDGKLKLGGCTEDLYDVIPSEVKVCHVVQVVQLLNETIETQRQGDLRIDRVITNWKSKRMPNKPKQTTKTTKKLKKR